MRTTHRPDAATLSTLTIAGHRITLVVGVQYWASRPGAYRGRTEYPVTIHRMINNGPDGVPEVVIPHLSYDAANALINAFNNGPMSFDGRVWTVQS